MGKIQIHKQNTLITLALFFGLLALAIITTIVGPGNSRKRRNSDSAVVAVNRNFGSRQRKSTSTPLADFKMFDNPALSQTDPGVLEYLLQHHLKPPSHKSYNFENDPDWDPSEWKEQIKDIFGDKRNGIFIEAGANDGEYMSNTLALERDFGWTGLLIEANNLIFPGLKRKHRKAWIANVCLAVKPYPHKVKILHRIGPQSWYRGNGIIEPNEDVPPPPDNWNRSQYISTGLTECFPLFSLLTALDMTTIDFFSLDVEGVEMKVLKTIPFDKVDIKVISVEHNVAEEGKEAIRELLESHGFYTYMETPADFIFVKVDYPVSQAL